MIINNMDLVLQSNNLRVSKIESFIIIGLYVVQKTDNIKWVTPSRLYKVIEKRCNTSKVYFYELLRKLEGQDLIIKREKKKGFNISLNASNKDLKAYVINSGLSYLSEVKE